MRREVVYCYLKQDNVSVEECTTSCGAPDVRPQCWADKGIAESFEGEFDEPAEFLVGTPPRVWKVVRLDTVKPK